MIISKLNACGFNLPALKLMHSYLSHRKQFNKFLSDLFLVRSDNDFSSYADDNTMHGSGYNIDHVISSLKESSENCFNGSHIMTRKEIQINAI